MSVQFIWDDKYTVCNDEIDRQHRYLFEMVNSLSLSADFKSYTSSVMSLYKYAMKHFKDEEIMMKAEEYPLAESHMKLHDELLVRLTEIVSDPAKDEEHLYIFRKFVFDWLVEHILHHDKKFMDFMQKKNTGN